MLINATQQEELRMAMVDGQRLYDLNIEGPANERKKANIYKAKITRLEPSLEAAFVDYGADRHGFLPLKEISPEYFVKEPSGGGKPNIKEVLREGQDIVVQIDKEERGNKGAALTTFVSLAGRFIVLKPNKDRSGGVSRRIVGSDRDLARKSLNDIEVPEGMSVILRTAGIDRSPEELQWDLENLMAVWRAFFDNRVIDRPSPFLIYREGNAVVRALRDYLTNEIGEILIDDEATYKEALEFVEQVMPHNARKLKHYTDPVPLFTRFQIETQIESAFAHSVNLPSGGSVVIDHTEALVSIDINSARATKGGDIEATALNTNLEAADEIARQLRIRDLGGLIVIDFIDMGPQKNQREVENRLREAVRQDRARVQIGKISRFGLLEMSRQRLRPSLGESSYQTCPRCSGFGTIRSVESLALAILRIIGEEARKERTAKVIAQLPVEVATYLLNEKRDWVQNLETDNQMQVVLIANPALETPHYEVRRVRDDQTELPENAGASYQLTEAAPEPVVPQAIHERAPAETAAVATLKPSTPAPQRREPEVAEKPAEPKGLFSWLAGLFGGGAEESEEPAGKRRGGQSGSGKQGERGKKTTRSRGGRRSKSSRDGDSGDTRGTDGETRKKSTKKKTKKKTKKTARKQTSKRDADTGSTQQGPGQDESPKDDTGGTESTKKKSSRSRRSRGGRRRRRSQDGGDAPAQTARANGGDQASDKPSTRDASAGKSQAADQPQSTDKSKVEDKPTSAPKQDRATADSRKPESAEPQKDAKPEQAAAEAKPAGSSRPDRGDEKPKPAADRATGGDKGGAETSESKPARPADDGGKKASEPKQRDAEPAKAAPDDGGKPEKPQGEPADDKRGNGRPKDDKPAQKGAEPGAAGGLLPWEPIAPPAKPSPDKASAPASEGAKVDKKPTPDSGTNPPSDQ
jgi:ribonuclease E